MSGGCLNMTQVGKLQIEAQNELNPNEDTYSVEELSLLT